MGGNPQRHIRSGPIPHPWAYCCQHDSYSRFTLFPQRCHENLPLLANHPILMNGESHLFLIPIPLQTSASLVSAHAVCARTGVAGVAEGCIAATFEVEHRFHFLPAFPFQERRPSSCEFPHRLSNLSSSPKPR
jgi:hypothetical protein